MAMLFMDGFDHLPLAEVEAEMSKRERVRWWRKHRRPRSGLVIVELPTMRWIGHGPVTFYLTENPAGPEYPASVRVELSYDGGPTPAPGWWARLRAAVREAL